MVVGFKVHRVRAQNVDGLAKEHSRFADHSAGKFMPFEGHRHLRRECICAESTRMRHLRYCATRGLGALHARRTERAVRAEVSETAVNVEEYNGSHLAFRSAGRSPTERRFLAAFRLVAPQFYTSVMSEAFYYIPSEEHPDMDVPAADAKLWRYMELGKLVSMLDMESVFFCAADGFSDKFEGAYPRHSFDELTAQGAIFEKVAASQKQIARGLRAISAVSCWHMNEHESMAMWGLYLPSNSGVAVQTTQAGLQAALPQYEKADHEHQIFIGKVRYLDYETEAISVKRTYSPLMHKRKSFEHEKEVRAIVQLLDNDWDPLKSKIPGGGVQVPVHVPTLVEAVYVSPHSPGWYAKAVSAVLAKYGLPAARQSKLLEDPVW